MTTPDSTYEWRRIGEHVSPLPVLYICRQATHSSCYLLPPQAIRSFRAVLSASSLSLLFNQLTETPRQNAM